MKPNRLLTLAITGTAALCLLLTGCEKESAAAAAGKKHTVMPSIQLVPKDGKFCAPATGQPFTGTVLLCLENGRSAGEEHYEDGLQQGVWTLLHAATGAVREEKTWARGDLVRKREWYPGGAIRKDLCLKLGEPVGWQRMWWEDGRLRGQSFLLPGFVPHGHRLEYAEDGSIIWDAVFDHGVLVSGTGPEPDFSNVRNKQAGMKPQWMSAAAVGGPAR